MFAVCYNKCLGYVVDFKYNWVIKTAVCIKIFSTVIMIFVQFISPPILHFLSCKTQNAVRTLV